MDNSLEILSELRNLRLLVFKLIGIPEEEIKKVSPETIEKISKEYQKLSIERGEWIDSGEVNKYIKNAPYNVGNFLREEFGFQNYFKRGKTHYYNKKDIVELGKELKKRNVDLGRYMELKQDQEKFNKYVESILMPGNLKGKRKKFRLPPSLKDIMEEPPKMPDIEILRSDLKNLKTEFFEKKLSEYIQIYGSGYAMSKHLWGVYRYIDPDKQKRIRKWIEDFNIVNELIKRITKKREEFIPVPEQELIQL